VAGASFAPQTPMASAAWALPLDPTNPPLKIPGYATGCVYQILGLFTQLNPNFFALTSPRSLGLPPPNVDAAKDGANQADLGYSIRFKVQDFSR